MKLELNQDVLRETIKTAPSFSWQGGLDQEGKFREIFPPESIRIEGNNVIAEFALSGDDDETDAIVE